MLDLQLVMLFQKYRCGVVIWSLFSWINLWLLPTWSVLASSQTKTWPRRGDNEDNSHRDLNPGLNSYATNESVDANGSLNSLNDSKSSQQRCYDDGHYDGGRVGYHHMRSDTANLLTKYYYPAFMELAGFADIHQTGSAALLYDLFIPWSNSKDALFFMNPRIMDRSGSSFEGNLHLGYRCRIGEQAMLGSFVAWDRRRLDSGCFNQITWGMEVGYLNWWLGGNLYQPIGRKWRQVARRLHWHDRELIETEVVQTANAGVDMRVGYAITSAWNAYLGGYYFKHHVKGGGLTLEYECQTNLWGLPNRLTWVVGGRYDNDRGANLLLGIKLRADFVKLQTSISDSLAIRRMGAAVRRDPDIVVTSQRKDRKIAMISEIPRLQPPPAELDEKDIQLPDKQGYIKRDYDWYREHFDELQQQDFVNWSGEELQCYRQWLLEQLCLDPELSDADLKRCWRAFVFKYHPDRQPLNFKRQAEKIFMQQQLYYQELLRLGRWARRDNVDAGERGDGHVGSAVNRSDNVYSAVLMLPAANSLEIEPVDDQQKTDRVEALHGMLMPAAFKQQTQIGLSTIAHQSQIMIGEVNSITASILSRNETRAGSVSSDARSVILPNREIVRTNYQKWLSHLSSKEQMKLNNLNNSRGSVEYEQSETEVPARQWQLFKAQFPDWSRKIVDLAVNDPAHYLDTLIYGIVFRELPTVDLRPLASVALTKIPNGYQRFYLIEQLLLSHHKVAIADIDFLVGRFNRSDSMDRSATSIEQRQILDLLNIWFGERQFVTTNYNFTTCFNYQRKWVSGILDQWLQLSSDMRVYAKQVLARASLTGQQLRQLQMAEWMTDCLQRRAPISFVQMQLDDDDLLAKYPNLMSNFYKQAIELRNLQWLQVWFGRQPDDHGLMAKVVNKISNIWLKMSRSTTHQKDDLLNDLGLLDLSFRPVVNLILPEQLFQDWQQWLASRFIAMVDNKLVYLIDQLAIQSYEQLETLMCTLKFLEPSTDVWNKITNIANSRISLTGFLVDLLDIVLQNCIVKMGDKWPLVLSQAIADKTNQLIGLKRWQPQHFIRLLGRGDVTVSYESGVQLLAILDILLQYSEFLTPSTVNIWGKDLPSILGSAGLPELATELAEMVRAKLVTIPKDLDQLVTETILNNPGCPQLKSQLQQFVRDYHFSLHLRENWLVAHYRPLWQPLKDKIDQQPTGVLAISADNEIVQLSTHVGNIILNLLPDKTVQVKRQQWDQGILRETILPQTNIDDWWLLQISYRQQHASDQLYQLAYQWGLLPDLHGVCKPLQQWQQTIIWSQEELAACLSFQQGEREVVQQTARDSSDFVSWYRSYRDNQAVIDGGEMLAVVAQVLYNVKGYYPRACQLLAAYLPRYYPEGLLLEVATGEGKSSIIAMFAAMQMLDGHLVDISTSSSELVHRDVREFADFYQHFAWLVGDNTKHQYTGSVKDAYHADLVYGDINSFIGDELHQRVYGTVKDTRGLADLHVVDEVDNLLIDNLDMMVMLGSAIPGFEQLNALYATMYGTFKDYAALIEERLAENSRPAGCYLRRDRLINHDQKSSSDQLSFFAQQLPTNATNSQNVDYYNLILADNCMEFLRDVMPKYLDNSLLKIGHKRNETVVLLPDTIQNFARAERFNWSDNLLRSFAYRPNIHYIIKEYDRVGNGRTFRQVLPVDGATGVTLPMLQWSNGLHAFIELREQLAPKPEHIPAIFQPFVDYFRSYRALYGFSGTLGSAVHHQVMHELYGTEILRLPSFMASGRYDYQPILARDSQTWLVKIVQLIHQHLLGAGRAVLVICDSIDEAQRLRQELITPIHHTLPALSDRRVMMYVYGGERGVVMERPICSGEVIISTNLAGRGADIKFDQTVLMAGGLHVIKTSLSDSLRVEQQAFGRAGRQGKPGSAQLVLDLSTLSSNCSLGVNASWQMDGTTYNDDYWQCLLVERDRREQQMVYEKITQEVKRQELQASAFDNFLLFRNKLLYGGKFSLQLVKQSPSFVATVENMVYCWQSSERRVWMGVRLGDQWQQDDISDYLHVVAPKAEYGLTREMAHPSPRLERLGYNIQSVLWFIIQHKWESQHARYLAARNRMEREFKECKKCREPYWHWQPTYLYENQQIDQYLLWLLCHPYLELLGARVSELSLSEVQRLMKLAGLRRLYEQWSNDAVASWDEELKTGQLVEDWGIWYHGRYYLTNEQISVTNKNELMQKLREEFAQFQNHILELIKQQRFYRNPGLLLKSVRDRSPLSSSRTEYDSLDHCIELCERAIQIGEAYNSYWLAWYVKSTLQLARDSLGITRQEEKTAAIPALQRYVQDMQKPMEYLCKQVIPRILSNLNLVIAHGMNVTSDYVMHEIGRVEIYRCITEVIEQNIKDVSHALQNNKEMATVGRMILPSELLSKMDVDGLYKRITNATANTTESMRTFDSSELVLAELDGYGLMLYNVRKFKLKQRNVWHYIGAGLLSLGVGVVGAVVNVMSGGVFTGVLGYNLLSNGVSSMIKSVVAWSKHLPLKFADFAKGCLVDTVMTTVLSAAMTFLDAIELINVHGRLLNLAQAHEGSWLRVMGMVGVRAGVEIAANTAIYRVISSDLFTSDIYAEAAKRVHLVITRQHDRLARIFLTDEYYANERLADVVNQHFEEYIANYRVGIDKKIGQVFSTMNQLSAGSTIASVTSYAVSISKTVISSVDSNRLLGKLEQDLEQEIIQAGEQSLAHRPLFEGI